MMDILDEARDINQLILWWEKRLKSRFLTAEERGKIKQVIKYLKCLVEIIDDRV